MTAYNCEDYIEKAIRSVMVQDFSDYECVITDDISTDATVDKARATIAGDPRFSIISNKEKLYQIGNYDRVIRQDSVASDRVCVEVDGDDWLATSTALSFVNELYKDPGIWLTSGSFRYSDGRRGFNSPISTIKGLRQASFTLSHLRTWRAGLWKKIRLNDMLDSSGSFWSSAGDLAFMWPMLEMSGLDHFRFIEDILYVYNETNPLNEHKVSYPLVRHIHHLISLMPPYEAVADYR
jgi:glycosyltransferase involved in cell wall biosynthesis